MFYKLLLLVSCLGLLGLNDVKAETSDTSKALPYRATATRVNDLVDTRLDVRFDYAKHYLFGKAWITVHPHAYKTDTVDFDAKGMQIGEVALYNPATKSTSVKLKFTYDSARLHIKLPRFFAAGENYSIFITYTARPDRLKTNGSAAITSDKGLYFINSDGADKTKPIQIWTQGESESASCWFPTFDKPNQRSTEEIAMTIPSKYTSLSNGRLISQKSNQNGTRTDTWKMDLPHAPYLFMMAVGDFTVFKDRWKDKEVSYYLEPKFAPFAKQIFGNTPEMIGFFSSVLGVEYPWNKYAQVVVRDYVSGAMENTTATLHGELVQKTARELVDGNREEYISHELFHQWFGDYVTCESWSNLTVNESFAAFSELLWDEHKYGQEKADHERMEKLRDYLQSFPSGSSPELVRYYYKSREDVFDLVTYNKGAVILYMLRNLIGNEAFYKGLHLYLTKNALSATEASQLRLAFEEASGNDLTQFFNQWYYKGGHPILLCDYSFNNDTKALTVSLQQVQQEGTQIFDIPLTIEVLGASKERHTVRLTSKKQSFTFKNAASPRLVTVDPEHILVGEVRYKARSIAQFALQYTNASNYIDRYQAVDTLVKLQSDPSAYVVLDKALADKNFNIRNLVCKGLAADNPNTEKSLKQLLAMAELDSSTLVRASALDFLGKRDGKAYEELFKRGLSARSLAVVGASLKGLSVANPKEALLEAEKLRNETTPQILEAVGTLFASSGLDEHANFFERAFSYTPEKYGAVLSSYFRFLVKSHNSDVVSRGVNLILNKISALHSDGYTKAVAQSFSAMASAKRDLAASQLDPSLKKTLTDQANLLDRKAEQLSTSLSSPVKG